MLPGRLAAGGRTRGTGGHRLRPRCGMARGADQAGTALVPVLPTAESVRRLAGERRDDRKQRKQCGQTHLRSPTPPSFVAFGLFLFLPACLFRRARLLRPDIGHCRPASAARHGHGGLTTVWVWVWIVDRCGVQWVHHTGMGAGRSLGLAPAKGYSYRPILLLLLALLCCIPLVIVTIQRPPSARPSPSRRAIYFVYIYFTCSTLILYTIYMNYAIPSPSPTPTLAKVTRAARSLQID